MRTGRDDGCAAGDFLSIDQQGCRRLKRDGPKFDRHILCIDLLCIVYPFDDILDAVSNLRHVNVHAAHSQSQTCSRSGLMDYLSDMNQTFAWDTCRVQAISTKAFFL